MLIKIKIRPSKRPIIPQSKKEDLLFNLKSKDYYHNNTNIFPKIENKKNKKHVKRSEMY